MKTKDRTKPQMFGGKKIPTLHGHTKITLRNVKTGEVEIYEKDNLVTDAVANIFARNYFGGMDYSKITPLRDMFGGVMCFEDALDITAVLPDNDGVNRLVAHAGQTAHSSDSILRGNPNGALSEEIQTDEYGIKRGYKFVWDFATNQGNGTISALALCHKWAGDIGLKPNAAETNEYLVLPNTNKTISLNGENSLDDFEDRLYCLLSVDMDAGTGLHVSLNGDTLTVKEVEICLRKQGINDTLGASKLLATHTVTLSRSYNKQYARVCTDGSYIYVMRANQNAGTTLQMDKVSMSTWTSTAADITDASLSLADVQNFHHEKAMPLNRAQVSGGYLYFPHSDLRSLYRFNLSSAADITLLETNLETDLSTDNWGLTEISEGLLLGDNFIINNNRVYPASTPPTGTTAYNQYYDNDNIARIIKNGDQFYIWTYGYDMGYIKRNYGAVVFPTCYLGTIQNLPQSVVKTNDKTMQIEYSILIAEEEEET